MRPRCSLRSRSSPSADAEDADRALNRLADRAAAGNVRDAWLDVAKPLGGAQFSPYNAASTLGAAMAGFVVPILYAIGVLSCVFHLANGLWTMGITWGIWTSPAAQKRANSICVVFGVGLAVVALSALGGAINVDEEAAKEVENRMYNAKIASGEIDEASSAHKRAHDDVPGPQADADHDESR